MEVFLLTLICVVVAGIIFFGGRLLLLAGNSLGQEKSLILKFQSFRNYLNPSNLLPLVILVLIVDLLFLVETIFIIRALYYLFLLLILFFLGNLAKLLIWDNREKIDGVLSRSSFKLVFASIFFGAIFSCIGLSVFINENSLNYSAQNNVSVNANVSAPRNNANNSFNMTKTPVAPKTNDAPTITPVVRAFYDALKKKDDAALRKVLTQASIKSLEEDMKAEGAKSLVEYVAESEILYKPVEVRNEKIEGDRATAEIKGGAYVNWTKITFVKENGEWKFTNKFEDVKP
jgi:hypothetical protein